MTAKNAPSRRRSGDDPALDSYLRDIRETPLLTADEEKELATRVRNGDLEARDRLTRANLRLVVSIAKQYANRGLTLTDLIEEGNVGLLKAVERFDPAADCRFSTYGAWWIKQSIRKALINTSRMVRVPSYMFEAIAKLRLTAARVEHELGRAPTFDEVAEAMGLDDDGRESLRRAVSASRSGRATTSLDSITGEGDSIPDPRSTAPDDEVSGTQDRARLQELLASIDPREADVLRLRFGIDTEAPVTLREIGERLGISRERVRQIEVRALRRLTERIREEDGPA
ncbi:MAG: RNA polymerase sigma factor SigA [Planctomycetes bacterium]|nr:RNA polymerase sigma factor SigA [Planctomycetota bacterium]